MSEEPHPPARRVATTTIERSYSVPFSEVWDLVGATVGRLGGWQVLSADSRAGTMTVMTASPFRHREMEALITMRLDELGQTRVEIRFDEPRHILLPPMAPQRGERFLKRVDRAVARKRGA